MKISVFLKNNNAYESFIANCKRVKFSGEGCLYSSFEHTKTPEKQIFWGLLMDKWGKVRYREFDMIFENGNLQN